MNKEAVKQQVNTNNAQGIARAVLACLGGMMISHGATSKEKWDSITHVLLSEEVWGAFVTLGTAVWSIYHKMLQGKEKAAAVDIALHTPIPVTQPMEIKHEEKKNQDQQI